jgi:hypothetical protein
MADFQTDLLPGLAEKFFGLNRLLERAPVVYPDSIGESHVSQFAQVSVSAASWG